MSKCAKATMADKLRAMALSWSLESHTELTYKLTYVEPRGANHVYTSCRSFARGCARSLS